MTIKEMLNKFKLNEKGEIDESLVSEIEKSIAEEIDTKVQEKAQIIAEEIANQELEKAKNELNEEYEEKFEEYKQMISEKFSDFVDKTLDEELQIPDEIKEYARKGQLYSDLIDQLKVRVGIDEGKLDEEARDLIREARDEIIKLKDRLNEIEGTNIDLSTSNKKLSGELYARKKCDGLTESQKARALKLLEGLSTTEEIDSKFDIIVESLFTDDGKNQLNESSHKNEQEEIKCVCPKCGKETTITEGSCNLYNCPDCEDTKLTDKIDDNDKKPTEESTKSKDGFKNLLEEYKQNFLKKTY